ncbi:hypothetical protein E2C01_054443 [Portunus trituberculatus]|uniref:Uncharacterized protein n=1 Tax=Portunus trituberculatus TaxID=210409 RepID=A0A5B7GS22_PORTR|nr:hypothetical protein [Portunus trituberculatus]
MRLKASPLVSSHASFCNSPSRAMNGGNLQSTKSLASTEQGRRAALRTTRPTQEWCIGELLVPSAWKPRALLAYSCIDRALTTLAWNKQWWINEALVKLLSIYTLIIYEEKISDINSCTFPFCRYNVSCCLHLATPCLSSPPPNSSGKS